MCRAAYARAGVLVSRAAFGASHSAGLPGGPRDPQAHPCTGDPVLPDRGAAERPVVRQGAAQSRWEPTARDIRKKVRWEEKEDHEIRHQVSPNIRKPGEFHSTADYAACVLGAAAANRARAAGSPSFFCPRAFLRLPKRGPGPRAKSSLQAQAARCRWGRVVQHVRQRGLLRTGHVCKATLKRHHHRHSHPCPARSHFAGRQGRAGNGV